MGAPETGPGYTGHVGDSDSGLVYMQARYFDPTVGRFLSVDPAYPVPGDMFAFNRFNYANNSPLTHVDPDGKVAIVTQLKDGGIRVQYPTRFVGPAATLEHVSAIKEQISAMSGTYSIHGKDTKVTFEVTEVSTKLFGGTPHGARNEVKLVNGKTSSDDGRSHADLGGRRAEIDVTDRLVKNGVAPHEFSHLGGVDDLYDKATNLPDPAKGDSIMNRVPGRVDSDTVQGIIDYKGNVQRKEP